MGTQGSPRARFVIDPPPSEELLAEIESIPGVWARRGAISVPDNAIWIVDHLLESRQARFRKFPGSTPPLARNARPALSWLHPMVVEPGFLTSYQREGVARALSWPNESGLFVWSAGSGKTLAGILWALSAGPAISIVVTKAAIRPSWDRQIREYTRGVELRSLIGESPDPAALASFDPARPVIFITGYDTLPAWIGALERLRPARVVFDEIHRAKSHQRWDAEQSWEDEGKVKFSLKENQAAACLRLSKVTRHRLGLTATPIRDRVRDLWAQLDLVRPGDFGGFWPFAKRYCNTPDAPIWMADYSFRPLGEIKVGDSVIGWIRKHGSRTKSARGPRRVLARSVVTHVQRREAEIVELEMQSGRKIRCTPDHQWLTTNRFGSNVDNQDRDDAIRSAVSMGATYKQAGSPFGLSVPSVWRVVHFDKTYEYLPAKVGRPLCFVANPDSPDLTPDQAWAAAWLGGVYDGEGHDNFIAQSQKHNPEAFARIGEALEALGVPAMPAKEGASCGGWRISGGRDGLLHFQKIVRSVRFPKVADRTMLTGKFRKHPDPVVRIKPLGMGEVISLTTTTGNYVAWGYASKNCAARENPFGGMDTRGSSNLEELQRRLGFVVHSVPHSLANRSLPPARRLVTFIPIAQQVRAEGSRNLIRGALHRGAAGLREALLMEAASRKRKIILDHVLDAIDGKLKIVIFTGRKIDVESIRAAIAKKAPGCPLWAATGNDSPEQRDAWRLEYMAAPGPAVFVATGESCGEGQDYQDTDLGIMAMLPYTPGQVIQYEGRWVRLGMRRPVEIRYFVAEGTIDEHVSAILLEKLPAIERTVDLDEVSGLTSELAGDESELIASMATKVLAA